MNWVEGSAENGDAAGMVLGGGAMSLRGGQCFSGIEITDGVGVQPLNVILS
jgi:hypothetical protein